MPLRLIHAHNNPIDAGGAEVMFRGTVDLLRRAGHDVCTLTRDTNAIGGPLAYTRAAFAAFHSAAAGREMADLVRRFKPNLVHLHRVYPLLSPSVLAPCIAAGVPLVMRLMDHSLICPTRHISRARKPCTLCLGGREYNCVLTACTGNLASSAYFALRTAAARTSRVFLAGIDVFTTPSESLRADYVASGFPAERVVVVPNFVGIPLRRAEPAQNSYVAYVGRLSSEKGIETLLQAARLYGGPVHVAGAGPMMETAVRSAPPNVRFLGLLRRSEVAEFMRNARCVVAPSVCSEAFCVSAAEAMALGVPVVASRIGALPEVVADGETGLLTTPGDPVELAEALDKLRGDPRLAGEMGRRGRTRAIRRFGPALYLRRLLDVYALSAGEAIEPAGELAVGAIGQHDARQK